MKKYITTIILLAGIANGALVPLELGVMADTKNLKIERLAYIASTPPTLDDPATEEDESGDGSPALLVVQAVYEIEAGRQVIAKPGLSIGAKGSPEFRVLVELTEAQFSALYGEGAQAVIDSLAVVGEIVPTGEVLAKMKAAILGAVQMLTGVEQ